MAFNTNKEIDKMEFKITVGELGKRLQVYYFVGVVTGVMLGVALGVLITIAGGGCK